MSCISSQTFDRRFKLLLRSNRIIVSKFRKLFSLSKSWNKPKKRRQFSWNLNNYFNLSNNVIGTMPNVTDVSNIGSKFRPRCSAEDSDQEISTLFCRDSFKQIHQILFKTCNVKIFLIHFDTRDMTDFDNDKQTLTDSRIEFKETCQIRSSSFWRVNRFFYLNDGKNKTGCVKGIKDVHPIKIYNRDNTLSEKEKKKKERKICCTKRFPSPIGKITMKVDGIEFHIQCKILTLDSMRNRLSDYGTCRYSYNDSQVSMNQAMIIAKYKNDLIQFKFDMSNITIQPANFQISRASQVVDELRFIPYFHNITARKVYIPVPKSTVDYVDPMIKIRFRQVKNTFDPPWLKTVRQQRLKRLSCRFQNFKSKDPNFSSTMISIENGGIIYKIKAGMLKINKIKNTPKYESFVKAHQRKELEKKWEKIRWNPTAKRLIPDWNIEKGDW